MDIPGTDHELTVDLVSVLVVTLLTIGAVVTPEINGSPVRIVLGIAFVFFVPGYVLTAVLFPRTSEPMDHVSERFLGPVDRNFTKLERVSLSIGLSVSVIILLALAVDISPWPLSIESLLPVVVAFTLLGTAVATRRRRRLPPENRFGLDLRSGWRSMVGSVTRARSDRIVNLFLILSILLAGASITYAATTPRDDEEYTRFYLLSENSDGELVASNYTSGDGADGIGEVVVGIENSEHRQLNYSVVVLLRSIDRPSDSATASERELVRFSTVLSHGETERAQVASPSPSPDGSYRMVFLLYIEDVPEEPGTDNAYRQTHLLIGTTDDNSSEGDP